MSKALQLFKLALKFQKLAEDPVGTVPVPNPISSSEDATTPIKPGPGELTPNQKRIFEEFARLAPSATEKDFSNWIAENSNIQVNHKPFNQFIGLYNWWYNHKHDGAFLEATLSYNRDLDARLYTTPQKFADVVQEAMIPKTHGIPNLWLYIGSFKDYEKPIFNKDLSHNVFIWTALSSIFDINGHPQEVGRVQDFVEENIDKINKIRKFFTHQPKYLGRGADGVAFDIGSFVLKIFLDEGAASAASSALERLHTQPSISKTEAMIYDVGVLGEFYNLTIYYYIMEKMKPIAQDNTLRANLRLLIKEIVTRLFSGTDIKSFKKDFAKADKNAIAKKVAAWSSSIATSLGNTSQVESIEFKLDNLKKTWLNSLVEEIAMKYLTDRTDLHLGNLGVNSQGEFRYFDPAYSGHTSAVNIGGEQIK